jgi:hypothetical protein
MTGAARENKGTADADDADGEKLWAERFTAIPRPDRLEILEVIFRLSREARELAAEVARLTPPPTRAQRIAARNRAYRDALSDHYRDFEKTNAAKELAADLKRYAQGEFRLGRDLPADASAHRKALHAILILSECGPLKWRQITQIC